MEPIIWQIHEYEHYEKTPDWFWIVGIIGATLAVLAVIFNSILFAVLIVIATVSIIIFGNKAPHLLDCEINKKGVRVNRTFYPYSNLDSFNLTDGYSPKLLLKSKKLLMPLIIIPVGDIHPDEIVPVISELIKHEEELREPFAHVLMDYLGF